METSGCRISALKRIDEALKEFEEAICLRPDFGRAHLNAAAILAAKGDFIGAQEHLQKAAKDTDPKSVSARCSNCVSPGGRQAVPPA
jgi:tetratricopeptide (TPR) repeat protein